MKLIAFLIIFLELATGKDVEKCLRFHDYNLLAKRFHLVMENSEMRKSERVSCFSSIPIIECSPIYVDGKSTQF